MTYISYAPLNSLPTGDGEGGGSRKLINTFSQWIHQIMSCLRNDLHLEGWSLTRWQLSFFATLGVKFRGHALEPGSTWADCRRRRRLRHACVSKNYERPRLIMVNVFVSPQALRIHHTISQYGQSSVTCFELEHLPVGGESFCRTI